MNLIDLYEKLGITEGKIPLPLLNKIVSARPNEIIVNDSGLGKENIKVTYKLKEKCIKLVNKDERVKEDNS